MEINGLYRKESRSHQCLMRSIKMESSKRWQLLRIFGGNRKLDVFGLRLHLSLSLSLSPPFSLSPPLSLPLSLSLSPPYRGSKSPMSVEGRHQYEELQLVTLLEVIRLRCPRCLSLSLSHTHTHKEVHKPQMPVEEHQNEELPKATLLEEISWR